MLPNSIAVLLAIRAKQTDSQSQIQGKSRSYLPIILEVRFSDLVTLVVAMLRRILGKALNESFRNTVRIGIRFNQKIGEGISRTVRQIVKSQKALRIARSCADDIVCLVALGVDVLRAELERMFAER